MKKTGSVRIVQRFQDTSYLNFKLSQAKVSVQHPSPSFCLTEDFRPTFLDYARIYVFAEQYMIGDLKALTMHKLYNVLKCFTLSEKSCPAILELARFAYNNTYTADRGTGEPVDQLRELIVMFISLYMGHFNRLENHRSLLREQPEYAIDLVDVLHKSG